MSITFDYNPKQEMSNLAQAWGQQVSIALLLKYTHIGRRLLPAGYKQKYIEDIKRFQEYLNEMIRTV